MKWCPGPDCQNAIMLEAGQIASRHRQDLVPISIHCSCSHLSCFDCGEAFHEPVSCEGLRQWKASRIEQDRMIRAPGRRFRYNLAQIIRTIGFCPGCELLVEKIGGCDLMTCSNCQTKFCWKCLGLWKPGHFCDPSIDVVTNSAIFNPTKKPLMEKMQKFEQNIENIKEISSSWKLDHDITVLIATLYKAYYTVAHSTIFMVLMTSADNQILIFAQKVRHLESLIDQVMEQMQHFEDARKGKVFVDLSLCKTARLLCVNYVREGYVKNWWRHKWVRV